MLTLLATPVINHIILRNFFFFHFFHKTANDSKHSLFRMFLYARENLEQNIQITIDERYSRWSFAQQSPNSTFYIKNQLLWTILHRIFSTVVYFFSVLSFRLYLCASCRHLFMKRIEPQNYYRLIN